MQHIFRYLKGTPSYGLSYKVDGPDLHGYYGANYKRSSSQADDEKDVKIHEPGKNVKRKRKRLE